MPLPLTQLSYLSPPLPFQNKSFSCRQYFKFIVQVFIEFYMTPRYTDKQVMIFGISFLSYHKSPSPFNNNQLQPWSQYLRWYSISLQSPYTCIHVLNLNQRVFNDKNFYILTILIKQSIKWDWYKFFTNRRSTKIRVVTNAIQKNIVVLYFQMIHSFSNSLPLKKITFSIGYSVDRIDSETWNNKYA